VLEIPAAAERGGKFAAATEPMAGETGKGAATAEPGAKKELGIRPVGAGFTEGLWGKS
jgi:hypothetical protein